MSRFCIICGSQLAASARFCGDCGAAVSDAVPTSVPGETTTNQVEVTEPPFEPAAVVEEPVVEYADAAPVEALTYPIEEPIYAEENPKRAPIGC